MRKHMGYVQIVLYTVKFCKNKWCIMSETEMTVHLIKGQIVSLCHSLNKSHSLCSLLSNHGINNAVDTLITINCINVPPFWISCSHVTDLSITWQIYCATEDERHNVYMAILRTSLVNLFRCKSNYSSKIRYQ